MIGTSTAALFPRRRGRGIRDTGRRTGGRGPALAFAPAARSGGGAGGGPVRPIGPRVATVARWGRLPAHGARPRRPRGPGGGHDGAAGRGTNRAAHAGR